MPINPFEPLKEEHLHGTLYTLLSCEQIARLYAEQGWGVRKCGQAEYEVETEWACLVIESCSPILMHGPVEHVSANIDLALAPLREAGVGYSVEWYGSDGELIRQWEHAA